jgi:hypothetical protein
MAEADPGGEQDFTPGFAGQDESARLSGEVFEFLTQRGGARVSKSRLS